MRYKSEAHRVWHRRVEGQIRDCMGQHPRWFKGMVTGREQNNFVRSLAKRIVGEILAGGALHCSPNETPCLKVAATSQVATVDFLLRRWWSSVAEKLRSTISSTPEHTRGG